MSQQISFDWLTDEEVYLRESAHAVPTSPAILFSDGERKLVLILLRSLAALLILVAAAGSTALSPGQLDRIETEDELRAVLDMEEDAWRARDRDAHGALIDPQVGMVWVDQWRGHWSARSHPTYLYTLTLGPTQRLGEDLVRAEVDVSLDRTAWWQPAALRETRFYLNAGDMWLRTLPPDSFWGEQRTWDTPYFAFYYHDVDANSVRAAADQLDAAYIELLRMVDREPIPEDRRLTIIVKPGLANNRGWSGSELNVHRLGSGGSVLEVTSPILAQIPQELSHVDYLTARILSHITSSMLRERRHIRMRYDWAFLSMVLPDWLDDQILGHPSPWSEESADVFRKYAAETYPLQLEDEATFVAGGQPGRDAVLWRLEAATSLLDYAVERGGMDVLPVLLDGFAEHRSWPPLIEDVFDTSAEEFTDGWNRYLADKYGISQEQ